MNDFDFDVMERKRIASNARRRKCCSKSKKCSLPTDHMTQKQWKERNGKVMSYQMNAPMSWAEFKEAPVDIQEMYIRGLMEKFGVLATDLGGMFGVGARTVSRYCKEVLPGIVFRRGSRITKENRAAFAEFCGKNDDLCDKAQVVKMPNVRRAVPYAEAIAPANASSMAMNRFSLHFSGRFDANMMLNSLSYMLPDGAEAEIEIICNVKNT